MLSWLLKARMVGITTYNVVTTIKEVTTVFRSPGDLELAVMYTWMLPHDYVAVFALDVGVA